MSEQSDTPTDKVATELAQIRQLIDERIRDDQVRERAFETLYEELKQYKDDFAFKNEKPLLLDLLLFYDSLNWFQESVVKADSSSEVVADSFQYLIDEFVELLYRRDINPMETENVFDRTLHKAVKVIPAEDKEQDQHIAQVLKRGFMRGDRVLRAEEVVIARFRAGKDEE